MKKIFDTVLNVLLVGVIILYIGKYFYMRPKFKSGENIPNITASTLHGQSFDLQQLKGSYVLVDFWGSWCGPCRAENPKLVDLYKKHARQRFKDAQGFEIISVAIEKDSTRWKNAVVRDQLDWPYQIMDSNTNFKFFNGPIANEFGVKQIPTKYLLGPDGSIIAVNPSIEEIDQLLQSKEA